MKKIIALLLALLMLFSMIGCDLEDSSNNNNNSSSKSNTNKNNNTKVEEIIYNTVSFQTNGGTKVQSQSIKTLKEAPKTTKEGHVFEGWFLDETLTQAVVYPLSINKDMTLYAKWLRIHNTEKCNNTSIESGILSIEGRSLYVTPSGFDMDTLAKRNYSIKITVTLKVYYEKTYNAPLDIGYFGAPKFEMYLVNSDNLGDIKENIKATESPKNYTLTYQDTCANIKNDQIKLTFSSDNVQNAIYFEDIIIDYQCFK